MSFLKINNISFTVNYSIIGLCIGGVTFAVLVLVGTYYCYQRRRRLRAKRNGPDQPLAFHSHRRPTAVKSPAGAGTGTHYLKKSPSPTGISKTPPGVSIIIINLLLFVCLFFLLLERLLINPAIPLISKLKIRINADTHYLQSVYILIQSFMRPEVSWVSWLRAGFSRSYQ